VGLLLLYYRVRPNRYLAAWTTAGFVTVFVYFFDFSSKTAGSGGYVIHHPVAAVEFFLVAIGDVVGVSIRGMDATAWALLFVGLAIVVSSAWVVIAFGLERDRMGGTPIAIALICLGMLFAASVVVGRTSAGIPTAGASRYTTFDLLILVGLYLILVEQFTIRRRADREAPPLSQSSGNLSVADRKVH
jgi:hypothetical protein